MKIIWKDSTARPATKPRSYRGFIVRRRNNAVNGWVTDLPHDRNVYNKKVSAQRAIDAYYGDLSLAEERQLYEFQIIGKKKAGD